MTHNALVTTLFAGALALAAAAPARAICFECRMKGHFEYEGVRGQAPELPRPSLSARAAPERTTAPRFRIVQWYGSNGSSSPTRAAPSGPTPRLGTALTRK